MLAGKAGKGRKEGFLSLCDEEIRSESCRQAVRAGEMRARLPVEDCSLHSLNCPLQAKQAYLQMGKEQGCPGGSSTVGHGAY